MNQAEKMKVEKEIELMRKFSHPYIVQYLESFIEAKRIIIIMEYCEAGDLDQLIQKHSKQKSFIPEENIIEWMLQLVSALSHIHSLKIIHRDIKPANIFVSIEGSLKLGDFGISKALSATNDVALTQIGTPYFMSPEVCNNEPYSNKCDIWALGCVFYELISFKKPFEANSFFALAIKIMSERPAPLPSIYSQNLTELIFTLLNKDPPSRPSCGKIFSMIGMKDIYSVPKRRQEGHFYKSFVENIDFECSVEEVEQEYHDDFESVSSEFYEEDFEQ
jgi:NIMA (never in mitosis gene a)-related kinase